MKTLVLYNGKIIGITEQELNDGDVLEVEVNGEPLTLVTMQVDDAPTKFGIGESEENSNDIEVNDGYQKVAYLTYYDKASKNYKRKTSQKSEKNMAKTIGGKTQIGSGAFNGLKGDVTSSTWLGEHKYTDAQEYRLKKATYYKIVKEANEAKKTPVLEILLDQDNRHVRLIFMSLNDFYNRTMATEDELLALFYFKQYKPKTNSVLLKVDEILEHDIMTSKQDKYKIPAFFITFNDNTTLFGMFAKDFEKVFMRGTEEE